MTVTTLPHTPVESPALDLNEIASVLGPYCERCFQRIAVVQAGVSVLALFLGWTSGQFLLAGSLTILAWVLFLLGWCSRYWLGIGPAMAGTGLLLFAPGLFALGGGRPEFAAVYFLALPVITLARQPFAVWPPAFVVLAIHSVFAADFFSGLTTAYFHGPAPPPVRTAVHLALGMAHAGLCYVAAHRLSDRLIADAAHSRQDHLLSLVAQQVRCGVAIGDEFARAVWVNDGFCQLTGYEREELIGCDLSNMLGRKTPPGRLTLDSFRTDKSSGTRSAEVQLQTKDSSVVWVARSIAPMPSVGRDGVSGFVAVAIDITPRKKAEAETARLVAILEATPDLVIIAEPDGTIVYANPAAQRLAGPLSADRSATFHQFHPPWALKKLLEEGLPTAVRQGVWFGETALLGADGTEIPTSQVVIAHKSADGRVEYFATILRDIRDRKMTESMLHERHRLASLSAEVAMSLNRPDSQPRLLQDCCEILLKYTGAAFVRIWTLSPGSSEELILRASAGIYTHIDGVHSRIRVGQFKIGRIAAERLPVLTNAVQDDPQIHDREWAKREGMVAFAGHPLICGGELVGVLALFARHELSDDVRQALQVSADAIALGLVRQRAEEKLRQSEERFRAATDGSLDAFWLLTLADESAAGGPDFIYADLNRRASDLHAGRREDIVGRRFAERAPAPLAAALLRPFQQVWRTGEPWEEELALPANDLGLEHLRVQIIKLSNGLAVTARDITRQVRENRERDELEQRMLQSQKLESLGVLAGGIAHDFNNLLTGVLGYAELMEAELPAGSDLAKYCRAVVTAAVQAAGLCKQMLAYAGKGQLQRHRLAINDVIGGSLELIRTTVTRRLQPELRLGNDIPPINGDEVQIRQLVLNLVINAGESIGDAAGLIVIATGSGPFDPRQDSGDYLMPELPAGEYVWLEVRDTGAGIAPELLPRIFEPFFTTKFTGRGLGLSAVLGIVRGHGGAIRVVSRRGGGCAFRIYFPVDRDSPEPAVPPGPTDYSEIRSGAVALVIDDEDPVRTVIARLLESFGLTVVVADSPEEGIRALAAEPSRFQVALVDLTMPQTNGEETTARLKAIRPDLPVLIMSGYSEQELAACADRTRAAGFVHKPFQREKLREQIRRVIAG